MAHESTELVISPIRFEAKLSLAGRSHSIGLGQRDSTLPICRRLSEAGPERYRVWLLWLCRVQSSAGARHLALSMQHDSIRDELLIIVMCGLISIDAGYYWVAVIDRSLFML